MCYCLYFFLLLLDINYNAFIYPRQYLMAQRLVGLSKQVWQKKIWNKHNRVKNSLWLGKPIGCFISMIKDSTLGLLRRKPASCQGRSLTQGLQLWKSSALTAQPHCLPLAENSGIFVLSCCNLFHCELILLVDGKERPLMSLKNLLQFRPRWQDSEADYYVVSLR